MRISLTTIRDEFHYLYRALYNRDFRKTLRFTEYNERQLLPLVRMYLLGAFGNDVTPEVRSKLPGGLSGSGSIDFLVGNTAIEFAVRRPLDSKRSLSDTTNTSEIKKLVLHRGPSLLVLFDFSKHPFARKDLERYREWKSLGRGNHRTSAFNVAYFHRKGRSDYDCISLNIRRR